MLWKTRLLLHKNYYEVGKISTAFKLHILLKLSAYGFFKVQMGPQGVLFCVFLNSEKYVTLAIMLFSIWLDPYFGPNSWGNNYVFCFSRDRQLVFGE